MANSFPGLVATGADPGNPWLPWSSDVEDCLGGSGEELELRRKNIDGVVNFFFILSFFGVPDWLPFPGPAPSNVLSFVLFMLENGGL